MPHLNREVIGKTYPSIEYKVEEKDSMFYALATNNPNPHYIDGTIEGGLIAPPMFAVRYGAELFFKVFFDDEIGENFFPFLVHGEQDMEWFQPVKLGKKVTSTATILDIQDKGTGEAIIVEVLTTLSKTGEKVCRQVMTFFVRGFGKLEKKEKSPKQEVERGEEAFVAQEKVMKGQSFVYAHASTDHNPIHLDDAFAKQVGLGGIILHGLCTMAFCHKAIVDQHLDGDPLKLRRLSVRFSKPVYPGDNLTIRAWKHPHDENELLFETTNQKGEFVIKNGRAFLQDL